MAAYPEIQLKRIDSGEIVGTKLGGEPTFIQSDYVPECCGAPMNFLGQIDTVDIPARFPDSAVVYVFVCPKCFQTDCRLECC